jgi:Holliday junction resolvasome RuvABC DNA-binding subunit
VSGFKIKYFDQENKPKTEKEKLQSPPPENKKTIPEFLLAQTIKALIPYGFTSAEAREIIVKSYNEQPNDNPLLLVKQTLASLRSTNV